MRPYRVQQRQTLPQGIDARSPNICIDPQDFMPVISWADTPLIVMKLR